MRHQGKSIAFLFTLALTLILTSACGNGEKAYPPAPINPEVDVCAVCNMSLVHDEYITQLITTDKTAYKFDDIGCMVEFIQEGEEAGMEFARIYVKDYSSNEWMDWNDAIHLYHPQLWTPMAYGVISFANEEDARQLLAEYPDAQLLTTEELFNHDW